MDRDAKILLPESNGIHRVSKSHTGWKFGLKFSCQSFSRLLVSKMAWSKHVSLRLSPNLHQGFSSIPEHLVDFPSQGPGLCLFPKKLTHRLPAPWQFFSGNDLDGKVLALVLWSLQVLWFWTEGLKHNGVLAVKCLGSPPGEVKTLVVFL